MILLMPFCSVLAVMVMVYAFFEGHDLVLAVVSFAFVLLALSAAQAGPKTTIEEFITGPGKDNSTLIVVCASGRRIELVLSNKFIKERNVDRIYDKLIAECEK